MSLDTRRHTGKDTLSAGANTIDINASSLIQEAGKWFISGLSANLESGAVGTAFVSVSVLDSQGKYVYTALQGPLFSAQGYGIDVNGRWRLLSTDVLRIYVSGATVSDVIQYSFQVEKA